MNELEQLNQQLKDDFAYLGESSDISQERREQIAKAAEQFINKLSEIVRPFIEWVQEQAALVVEKLLTWVKAVERAGSTGNAGWPWECYQVRFVRPAFHRLN